MVFQPSEEPDRSSTLSVLTLSTLFPNRSEPGLGIFVRARLRAMAAAGASIKVVAPIAAVDWHHLMPRIRSGVAAQESSDGLEVFHPRWLYPPKFADLNPVWLAGRIRPLAAALHRQHSFRIVDAQFGFPDGPTAAIVSRQLQIPYSITMRGSEVDHAGYPLRRRLLARAFRGATSVIPVSETLRQLALQLGADPSRIRKIPNGIDATVFFPRDPVECRRRHGLPAEAPVLLAAGHLIELKGHHLLIAALPALHRRGIPAHLVIAGDSGRAVSFEPELRRQIESLGLNGYVRFAGHVTPRELAELMSAADVFCMASAREGWPNVVVEAMACGTPVVAHNVGAVPEMIDTPKLGSIVAPGDASQLEEALASALKTSWDSAFISSRGQARSWSTVGQETVEQLRRAAAQVLK